ncbi:MAG: hypothetical protein IPM67_12570 [Sphingomonadales bacterium]|jgi:hypothetical protein|nr:hypothetical protein [Sphingomonadales bacterium]MBK9269455.1 hypothetical protein [Sphingomonadales bacterium]
MTLERTSNNFDIDSIRREADAMENAGAIDPAAAFASDVEEMIDDLRYNPSTNLAEEAAQILNSPLAARLDSGVLMNLRAAVNLQEEKQENGSGAFMRGDTWNEQRERDDRDRKEQSRVADMIDDVMGNQLSTTPDRYGVSQRDYAELNDEFKTRDGQERFMNFLRMMYPNMSDAERERFAEDARVIAAVRSGNATDADRSAYNNMTEGRRDDVSGALGQYQQMDRLNPTSTLTNRVDGQAVSVSANASALDPQATTGARTDILSGGDTPAALTTKAFSAPPSPSLPISVAASVDGQTGISASQPLRVNFAAANAATAPLDQPASPQVVASAPPAPLPAANAGLDV